jgi:hypothetical protein
LKTDVDWDVILKYLEQSQLLGVVVGALLTFLFSSWQVYRAEKDKNRAIRGELIKNFFEAELLVMGVTLHFASILRKCEYTEISRPSTTSAPYIVPTVSNFVLSEGQIRLISNTFSRKQDRRIGFEGFSTDISDFFRSAHILIPLVSEHNRRLEKIDEALSPFSLRVSSGIAIELGATGADLAPLMPFLARQDVLIYNIARISINAMRRSEGVRETFYKSYTKRKKSPEQTAAGAVYTAEKEKLFNWWNHAEHELAARFSMQNVS